MISKMKVGSAVAAAGAGALAAYIFALRPWHLRWGATDDEVNEPLPGDEFVPAAKMVATHAITINAHVKDVWPWIVQIGQDKGGFYSYSWLENLVGCELRNADQIIPQFQQLQTGDSVRLHPKVPPLPVLICEPEKALVLGSNTESPGTWGFYLKPVGGNMTRLIVRGRGTSKPDILNWLGSYAVFEPAHFIMERKMLLGIKHRAETEVAA